MKNYRILSAILAIIMVFALVPTAMLAESIGNAANEAAAMNKLDSTWAMLEAAEAEALANNGATAAEVISAVFEAALNAEAVDTDSFSDITKDGFFFTVDGMHCAYNYRLRNEPDSNITSEGSTTIIKNENASKDASSADVFLVGPYYGGYDPTFTDQYRNEAASVAEATGGDLTILAGHDATGPAIAQNFVEKGVVFYDSHGIATSGSSYLCLTTNAGITSEDYSNGWAVRSGSEAFIDGRYIENHIAHPASNTIVWMAICEGMKLSGHGVTGEALLRAGCEVVYGYSQSVTFIGDYKYEETFWNVMKEGGTVREAITEMKDTWGIFDPYGDAYPIVMSAVDAFPANPDAYQEVNTEYTIFGELPPVALENISIDVTELNLTVGEQAPINFNRTPYNASSFDIEWSSTNDNVVTFYKGSKAKSILIASGAGSATITCSIYVDGQLFYSAPINVTVTADESLRAANAEGGELYFGTYGDYPFEAAETDGRSCVRSGNYHKLNSSSSLILTVMMNAGDDLSFEYRVSSEAKDYAKITVNGAQLARESGINDWKTISFTAPETGRYTFIWTYVKDASASQGDDRIFVANVALTSTAPEPVYAVTFVDGLTGSTIGSIDLPASASTLLEEHFPAAPNHEGYTFIGWDTEAGTVVTGNTTVTALYEANSAIPGDANGDGVVTMTDATLIARMALNLLDSVPAADFDGNGTINMSDATMTARKALNLI